MEKLPWDDTDRKVVSFKKKKENEWDMSTIPAFTGKKEKGFLVVFISKETDLYEGMGYTVIEKDMDALMLDMLMGEPVFSTKMEADLYALYKLGYFDEAINKYQL